MQYLLTEAEYEALKRDKDSPAAINIDELQALCVLAAQHIPVPHDWSEDKTPRPWGCILGPREQHPGYCDDCPCQRVCPSLGKAWSK